MPCQSSWQTPDGAIALVGQSVSFCLYKEAVPKLVDRLRSAGFVLNPEAHLVRQDLGLINLEYRQLNFDLFDDLDLVGYTEDQPLHMKSLDGILEIEIAEEVAAIAERVLPKGITRGFIMPADTLAIHLFVRKTIYQSTRSQTCVKSYYFFLWPSRLLLPWRPIPIPSTPTTPCRCSK